MQSFHVRKLASLEFHRNNDIDIFLTNVKDFGDEVLSLSKGKSIAKEASISQSWLIRHHC